MPEIIDLSQEIYEGMPMHHSMAPVKISVLATHEQWAKEINPQTHTPSALKLEMSEHTGTHVDGLNHMGKDFAGQTIDGMPLSMFYTKGICLDLTHKGLQELIAVEDIQQAIQMAGLSVLQGDTVLLCTDHYLKYFGTDNWSKGPGLTVEATRWLGAQKISAFGVETMSPGIPKLTNQEVHQICGEMGFTHYENLINLHLLIDRGRFRFIGFPLKIRGETGSPVRAVAVFE